MRWDYIYEPEDFAGWIPDFALLHKGGPTYVEVKPVYLDDAEQRKKHVAELRDIALPSEREVLLLGCEVGRMAEGLDPCAGAQLGWFAQEQHGWISESGSDAIVFHSDAQNWDFASNAGDWTGRRSRIHNKYFGLASTDSDLGIHQTWVVQLIWKEAGNQVQWNAR